MGVRAGSTGTYAYTYPDTYGNTYAYSHGDCNADSDSYPNRTTTYSHCNPYTNAITDATARHSDPNSYAYPCAVPSLYVIRRGYWLFLDLMLCHRRLCIWYIMYVAKLFDIWLVYLVS